MSARDWLRSWLTQPRSDAAQQSHANWEEVRFLGTLGEIGLNQYQIEWQRISMMQQSAGTLLATLAIIYSVISAFLSQPNALQMPTEAMALFVPTFITATAFAITATCYFFAVISPKQVKAIATPKTLYRELRGDMTQRASSLIQILTDAISSLNEHVENNQRRYAKGLNACKFAFVFTGVLVAIFLAKPVFSQTVINTYDVALTVVAVFGVCVVRWPRAV